jgi:hypothetical protein
MPKQAIENALVRMEATRENVDHLIVRAQIIDDAINRRMKDGVHYGLIPGTKRKALLKPGAEALQELFRLSSLVDSEVIDYPDQHREVRSKCTISAPDGTVIVQRSASCTTYETKYRYRTENTGVLVPGDYWKKGTPDYKNADVIGGADFFPRKVDGQWLVFHQIPVTNQPDNWHTVGSMAEKRAYVAAIIVACGASDALVPEDDQTYRENAEKERQRRTTERTQRNAERTTRETSRQSGHTESDGRMWALVGRLEKAGEGGMEALLDAWQDLSEDERVLVGKRFGPIKQAVEDRHA